MRRSLATQQTLQITDFHSTWKELQFSIIHVTEKIQNTYIDLGVASFSTWRTKNRRRGKDIFSDK